MAAALENTANEAPSMEKLPEVPSGDDAVLSPTENANVPETEGSLTKISSRSTAPPKRPLTTSRRPATAAAASLSTTSNVRPTTSRTTPGVGLNKPPTRPAVTAKPTRPATAAAATPSTSNEHKSRASTSSVDDGKRVGTGSETENKKPLSIAPSKRVSLNPANTGKTIEGRTTPSTKDRRSTVSSATSAEKKSSTSKAISPSPMKEALRTTTNNARPSPASATTRATRPSPSSTRVVPTSSASDATRKRLSTIPASPAQPSGSPAATGSQSTPSKSTRPVLGARQSTMSVTIEQRLREMELVSDMLQIAMAEEGAEDDEIKEDYGKRAEETLAAMRAKLEEARRNEGKSPVGAATMEPGSATQRASSNNQARDAKKDSNAESSTLLQAQLHTAQTKIARLELEIEAMSSKTQEFSRQAERASKEVQEATEAIRAEHITKIDMLNKSHTSEVDDLREQLVHSQTEMQEFHAEAERASKDVQKATEAIREEHLIKIDALSKSHSISLEDLRTQLSASQKQMVDFRAEAERASKDVQEATEVIRAEHVKKVETISKDHAAKQEEASKQHVLELETLRKQLADSQAKAQTLGAEAEHARIEVRQARDTLQKEQSSSINTLSANHDAELESIRSQLIRSQEELKRVTEQSVKDFEAARVSAREESSQDAVKVLEEQKQKHESALQKLHEQLASQEQTGTDSASKIQKFSADVARLTGQLEEEKRQHQAQLENVKKEQDQLLAKQVEASAQLEKVREEHAVSLTDKDEALARLETTNKQNEAIAAEKGEASAALEKIKQKHQRSLAEQQEALTLKEEELLSIKKTTESLRNTHSQELESLQSAHNEKLDKLLNAHSQMLETNETAARERLQKIESDYATSRQQLSETEKSITALSEGHKEVLKVKDQELASVAHVIETLQDQIQEVQHKKAREMEIAILELKQDHEKILALSNEKAETTQKGLESILTTVHSDHEAEIRKLRQQVELSGKARENAMEDLVTSRDKALELVKVLEKDRDGDQENKRMLERALEEASNEVSALKKVLEAFDQGSAAKNDEHRLSLAKINDELDNTAKMLQSKVAESTTLSDEHSAQIENLRQTHAKEVEDMKAEITQQNESVLKELQETHEALLQASKEAQESHASQLERLKAQHRDSLVDAKSPLETRIKELETQLAEVESQILSRETTAVQDISFARADHLKAIEKLQSQHQSTLADAEEAHEAALASVREQVQVLQTRAVTINEENDSQRTGEPHDATGEPSATALGAEVEDLKVQLAQAKSDAVAAKVENANLRRQKMQVEALRRQYSANDKDLRAALATDREAIDELTAAAEEIGQIMIDPTEIDHLKKQLSDLGERHTAEVAKLKESISIESERRGKERKQGAETRDRLAAELSAISTQLPAKDAEINNLRSVMELTRKEMQDANARLEQARAASTDQEAHHREESAELDNLKAELEALKQKANTSKGGHGRSKSSHNQELDALQTIADKERARTERLKQELDDALSASEKHVTRLREVEAALKVTTAELTEMKTRRADGSDFTTGSPMSKHGLRTSRWSVDAKEFTPAAVREALARSGDQGNRSPKRREGDLGAHIEGMMAGLQVQMRQIEDVNTDMLQDQQRMVNMLDRVTSSRGSRSQEHTREKGYSSFDEVS